MTFFITLCYSKGTTEPFFGAIAEAAERFETWGMGGGGGGGGWKAHLSPSHAHTPTHPKCSLRCSLTQANLFAIFTVRSSVSVIDL